MAPTLEPPPFNSVTARILRSWEVPTGLVQPALLHLSVLVAVILVRQRPTERSSIPVGLDFLGDEPHRTTPEPANESNRVLALRLEQGTEVLIEFVAEGERT